MSYIEPIKRTEVVDEASFARYVCQTLGTPYSTKGDFMMMKKKLKQLREEMPQVTWSTLVGTVDWARAKRKHPPFAANVIDMVRYAFADGYLPELDPNNQERDERLESGIHEALQVETDEEWRRRLSGSFGKGRKEVYAQWLQSRKASSSNSLV